MLRELPTGVSKFFAIARERYSIMLKRQQGLPRPWSTDPIFQHNRFCNVHREDDKATVWFREHIRDPLNKKNDLEAILQAIVIFRWFNKIEIGEVLLDPACGIMEGQFHQDDTKRKILAAYPRGPFVTGAYIMKTPDGMKKLDGVLWCIEQFFERLMDGRFDRITSGLATMQESCGLLQQSPYLGRFMAYQICADAQFTKLLGYASDIHTWAQPGPGSTRGIGRVFYNDVDKFKYGSARDEAQIIKHMQELLALSRDPTYWPSDWKLWTMQDVQNWNCEFGKYCVAEEGGHMKRKFG